MRIMAKTHGRLVIALALLALPMAAQAYTVTGKVSCQGSGFPLYGGEARAYEVDPVPGGSFATNLLFAVPLTSDGNFTATVTWPTAGSGFEAGDPDLVLEIVQTIDGTAEIVYQELSSSPRWNVPDGSNFNLESDSAQAVCPDPALGPSSNPADDLFLFTRIGKEETADIDCRDSAPGAEGYLRPRKTGFGATGTGFTGSTTDQPFGRTLDLLAWFGQLVNVDYYKLQYSSDDGATWTDVDTSLPNKWYDTTDPNPLNWHWVSQSMGPFSVGTIDNLYQIPYFVRPSTPWSWYDRVGRFDTTKVPDGLIRLRIEAYKWSGGSLVPAYVCSPTTPTCDLTVDLNYGKIALRIDNTPPTVEILDVKLNGASRPPCDILDLGVGATDKVSVEFRVRDTRGHLLDYSLNALYGHNCRVRPLPTVPDPAGDNYNSNAAASPSWQGSLSYTSDYHGSVYLPGPQVDCSISPSPVNRMPTCAYQFRLRASKRTTNGYGLIYHNVEDTWHATIQRP